MFPFKVKVSAFRQPDNGGTVAE